MPRKTEEALIAKLHRLEDISLAVKLRQARPGQLPTDRDAGAQQSLSSGWGSLVDPGWALALESPALRPFLSPPERFDPGAALLVHPHFEAVDPVPQRPLGRDPDVERVEHAAPAPLGRRSASS